MGNTFSSRNGQPSERSGFPLNLNSKHVPKHLKPLRRPRKQKKSNNSSPPPTTTTNPIEPNQEAVRLSALFDKKIDWERPNNDSNSNSNNNNNNSYENCLTGTDGFQSSKFRWLGGRRFHGDKGFAYPLPIDQYELDRLRVQYYIFRWVFEGLVLAPVKDQLRQGCKVLNVNCGPGLWMGHPIIDMAMDYKQSDFTTIDICNLMSPDSYNGDEDCSPLSSFVFEPHPDDLTETRESQITSRPQPPITTANITTETTDTVATTATMATNNTVNTAATTAVSIETQPQTLPKHSILSNRPTSLVDPRISPLTTNEPASSVSASSFTPSSFGPMNTPVVIPMTTPQHILSIPPIIELPNDDDNDSNNEKEEEKDANNNNDKKNKNKNKHTHTHTHNNRDSVNDNDNDNDSDNDNSGFNSDRVHKQDDTQQQDHYYKRQAQSCPSMLTNGSTLDTKSGLMSDISPQTSSFTHRKARVSALNSSLKSKRIFDNLEFCPIDVLAQTLPFEDNTFDYVQQSLVTLVYTEEDWDRILKELVRVTKPGGYIQLTEVDYYTQGAAQKHDIWQLNSIDIVLDTLSVNTRAAMLLSEMLTEAGLSEVETKFVSIPNGSWGLDIGLLWEENWLAFTCSVAPYLLEVTNTTWEDLEELQNLPADERLNLKAFNNAYCCWGRKPFDNKSDTSSTTTTSTADPSTSDTATASAAAAGVASATAASSTSADTSTDTNITDTTTTDTTTTATIAATDITASTDTATSTDTNAST